MENKNNVTDEEIVNYVKGKDHTVMGAFEHFKESEKLVKEMREIYANSNENRRLVYEDASELENNGQLFVNGAVDSVINVIRSVYHKNMNRNIIKQNLEKMDFVPMM